MTVSERLNRQTRRLRAFLALTRTDQHLLIESVLSLASIRVALGVLPYRTLVGALDYAGSRLLPRSPQPVRRVAWAVDVASRYLPGTRNCLVRALAARVLLIRCQHETRLRFGVARDCGGAVHAHAWRESGGIVVIAEASPDRFTALARPFERTGECEPPERLL